MQSLRHSSDAPVTGVVLAVPITKALQDEAAAKVWAFMEWSHDAAILKYLHKRIKERASDMVAGRV